MEAVSGKAALVLVLGFLLVLTNFWTTNGGQAIRNAVTGKA